MHARCFRWVSLENCMEGPMWEAISSYGVHFSLGARERGGGRWKIRLFWKRRAWTGTLYHHGALDGFTRRSHLFFLSYEILRWLLTLLLSVSGNISHAYGDIDPNPRIYLLIFFASLDTPKQLLVDFTAKECLWDKKREDRAESVLLRKGKTRKEPTKKQTKKTKQGKSSSMMNRAAHPGPPSRHGVKTNSLSQAVCRTSAIFPPALNPQPVDGPNANF